ncbi:MAG: hypothetical protein GY711_04095 [bacterium]|nr:hypothetical protein [bacterium]
MTFAVLLCGLPVYDDPDEVRRLLRAGHVHDCSERTAAALAEDPDDEEWHVLHIRALLAIGECTRAAERVEIALDEFRRSLDVRLVGCEVFERCGNAERAAEMLAEIETLVRRARWRYDDAENLVVHGRARLRAGDDAKKVMDTYYLPAARDDPEDVSARRAIAELALAKSDFKLAADELRAALALDDEDASLHLMLAHALAPSDDEGASAALVRALELDPAHLGALLLTVDRNVGAERYDAARATLERVLDVDPDEWRAWSYRAVLAHLEGQPAWAKASHERAFGRWKQNPGVDHLIGRELSEKYRFAEGAAYQERALELDADLDSARFQLAQDLLRLGREGEGWKLAQEVLQADPYNVVAYNLMVLHDVLAAYTTLETESFVVRMEAREADVYGARVLELMQEARDELCARYAVELSERTMLELFAEQKDFAIRTFGLPGGAGYLGVCFGDVVTMNSPASQGESPSCWEAVLWHEFCHVVTLGKTKNRMPRWLSEGISVYEEERRDPAWGQRMLPAYKERILAGEASRVSALSGAFLHATDPMALQFAYYESALVVDYIVSKHGFDALLGVLDDLAAGAGIDAALSQRVAPIDDLDVAFDAHLRALAEAFAPRAEWTEPERPHTDISSMQLFSSAHPHNVPGLERWARALIEADRAGEAQPLCKRAIELVPSRVGSDSAYALLARVHRLAGDIESELDVLGRWAARDASSLSVRYRLMEIAEARGDWQGVYDAARGALAIQPMNAVSQRHLGTAARELGRIPDVIRAARAQLALDPVDPARVHFELARASALAGDGAVAKREVLKALEEAPRFRAAHELLLELTADRRAKEGEKDE